MNIKVIIDNIEVSIQGSKFGGFRDTIKDLVSHCTKEALEIYYQTNKEEKK